MRITITEIMMLLVLVLSGCSSIESGHNLDTTVLGKCSEERPEMCTMQYEPVCARLLDNTRQSFSNSCSACAEKQTVAYQSGECK